MAVDDTLRGKLADHLKRVWQSPACLLCGCTVWEAHGHVTVLLSDVPGTLTGITDGLPTVALVCQRCGNTVFVNLVVAGALP